jgi:DNA-binding Xre family transcriptional regulator
MRIELEDMRTDICSVILVCDEDNVAVIGILGNREERVMWFFFRLVRPVDQSLDLTYKFFWKLVHILFLLTCYSFSTIGSRSLCFSSILYYLRLSGILLYQKVEDFSRRGLLVFSWHLGYTPRDNKRKGTGGKHRVSHRRGRSNYGQIHPRLKPLLETARATWGIPVSRRMVAKATRLSTTTVEALSTGQSSLYDLHTLWKVCWFLNCGIADLLWWVPPPGHHYRDRPPSPVRVGSITLPRTQPAGSPAIRIVIPEQLLQVKKAEISRETGLAESTVATLLNPDRPPTRIAETTLTAVLDLLSRREGEAVAVATLLVYDPPVL